MTVAVVAGVSKKILEFIQSKLDSSKLIVLNSEKDFLSFLDNPPDIEISCVIGGAELTGITPNEIAQSFKMMSKAIHLIYVTDNPEKFDTIQLVKDGYSSCSMYPIDEDALTEVLAEVRAKANGEKIYRSVLFADIEPNQSLDFDIYLYFSANKKYLKYVGKENALSKEQFERLTSGSYQRAHIANSEINKFYEFTASRLLSMHKDPTLSETEKRERLRKSVGVIFSELFSSSEDLSSLSGRKNVLSNAKNLIQKFIDSSGQDYIQKAVLSQVGAEKVSYSHPTNVSIYASLFALVLGIGDPGNMAVAGLVHDLGKDMLPAGLKSKNYEDMNIEEKKIYERHPQESISLLKKFNLPLSDDVHKAILHHHERIDGSGFPAKQQGRFVSSEGQILGIADQFDILTRKVEGKISLNPFEALQEIRKQGHFNEDYIIALIQVFDPSLQRQQAS